MRNSSSVLVFLDKHLFPRGLDFGGGQHNKCLRTYRKTLTSELKPGTNCKHWQGCFCWYHVDETLAICSFCGSFSEKNRANGAFGKMRRSSTFCLPLPWTWCTWSSRQGCWSCSWPPEESGWHWPWPGTTASTHPDHVSCIPGCTESNRVSKQLPSAHREGGKVLVCNTSLILLFLETRNYL